MAKAKRVLPKITRVTPPVRRPDGEWVLQLALSCGHPCTLVCLDRARLARHAVGESMRCLTCWPSEGICYS